MLPRGPWLLALGVCSLAACDSRATLPPSRTPAGGGDETRTTVLGSIDDPTPLGFTAAELVASVEGEYRGTLTWYARDGVTMTPTPGPTDLAFTVTWDGGEARYVERPEYLMPSATVDVDCVLGLETADGAFADNLPAILSGVAVGEAGILVTLSDVTLAGAFQAGATEPGWTALTVLGVGISGSTATGSIQISFTRPSAGGSTTIVSGEALADLTATRAAR